MIQDYFQSTEVNILTNTELREPKIEAKSYRYYWMSMIKMLQSM